MYLSQCSRNYRHSEKTYLNNDKAWIKAVVLNKLTIWLDKLNELGNSNTRSWACLRRTESEQTLNQSITVGESKSTKTKHPEEGSAWRKTWGNGALFLSFSPSIHAGAAAHLSQPLGDRSRKFWNSFRPAVDTWSLTKKQHPAPHPKKISKPNKTLSIWQAQQVLEESAGWGKQALQSWSTGQRTGRERAQAAPAHLTAVYAISISAISPSYSDSKSLLHLQHQQLSTSAVVHQHKALTPTASKQVFIYLFFILLKSTFLHPSNLSENLCSWIWSKFFNK